MRRLDNWIDGKWQPPRSQKYLPNINPSRGTVFSEVADSNAADVEAAVLAAEKAFPKWSSCAPAVRATFLRALAAGILARLEDFAKAEALDNGKPIRLAREVDIPRSAMNFQFFADAILQFQGESFRTDARTFNVVEHFPLGVVACISPWNLPLYLLTWKIAPALAAGNTVIAKPSELTPLTATLLAEVLQDIGLPPGVLNILHGTGTGVGAPLTSHRKIKAISFTGSTATGATIAATAARSFKKVSLEMGGKNPNIIFADANLDEAVRTTVRSTFSNQGQICLCGSRILVERQIYNSFRERLLQKVTALKIGDPMLESTEFGALVSESHLEKVLGFLRLAQQEQGQILCGGARLQLPGDLQNGFFLPPTLIENIKVDSQVNQEEIFGPVATLTPFDSEEEAVALANSTRYGLSASVWTEDLSKAQRMTQKLDCGIVWINCWMVRDLRTPFGGWKESGLGREGGQYALKFFSETKTICTQYPEDNT